MANRKLFLGARSALLVTLAAAVCWTSPGCRGCTTTDEPEDAPPTPHAVTDAVPEEASPPPPLFEWGFEPSELKVYRDTEVQFRLDRFSGEAVGPNAPPGEEFWEGLEVRWDFGDGSPQGYGRSAEHIYRGGQSDQVATVTVMSGDEVLFEDRRTVPLERLPVVPLGEEVDIAPDLSIPEAPDPTECGTTFRFVVLSDTIDRRRGVSPSAQASAAIERIIGDLDPALVIHSGNMVAGQRTDIDRAQLESMWEGFHKSITRPLHKARIPLLPVPGNHDAAPGLTDRRVYVAEWRKPENQPGVTLLDDTHYPLRYTFISHGAFFLVMDTATGRVDEQQLRWMRQQLRDARIYTARFVFSHVPLHEFADLRSEETGTDSPRGRQQSGLHSAGLDKHFRVYNLLLENNVTFFFSGHYGVYFKGRYGALRVASTGGLSGVRRTLSGSSAPQAPSLAVVDIERGRIKHVFAVTGPDFDRRFNENELPDEVEVYRYDPTFTPGFRGGAMPAGILD